LDELKGRQVIARKRGYGPDYVDLFVKQRKKDMREFARQSSIHNPIGVRREGKEGCNGGGKSTDAGLE